MRVTNWAGNVVFGAARVHRPTSIDELHRVVTGSERLRVLGTGHSFNRIADTTGDLVSVASLPPHLELDAAAGTVTVSAGLRYASVAAFVHERGFALHNLGSLPHISVAGACATGTHGSGVNNGILGTTVRGLEMMTADGELVRLRAGDPQLAGAVVALGALGVVTRLTLAVEPTFEVRQVVYDDLPHAELLAGLVQVLGSAYSVSAFTDWRDRLGWQVWRKQRVGEASREWTGGTAADGPRHPVPGVDPVHCTEQLGVPGPWHERLPHFRREFTPSSGEELQSEYLVPLERGRAALEAVADVRSLIAPVLLVSELRAIAADDLWLSPAQGRDSLAIHFTWAPDADAVTPVVAAVEAALAPFAARPHWGKVFGVEPEVVRGLYPRWADFAELLDTYDPAGRLRGDFVGAFFPTSGGVSTTRGPVSG